LDSLPRDNHVEDRRGIAIDHGDASTGERIDPEMKMM
jgi:hypothetical protein